MRTIQEQIADVIGKVYGLPKEHAKLAAQANEDLYNGPSLDPESDFPGFTQACRELSAFFDDCVPSTLYFDPDCGQVSKYEPQGSFEYQGEFYDNEHDCPIDEESDERPRYVEPLPYYTIEAREIKAALLGKELAKYV